MVEIDGELVGINEIAAMAKVSKQVITNWRARSSDFPKPLANLASGPVFKKSNVRSWLRKRKLPMAQVFATINLKGGVGKTTTTVALAEAFSSQFGKRVLVIDLDPQTNATTMLIGEDKWRKLNAKKRTLAQLFKDAVDPNEKLFDLDKTLQTSVSDVAGANSIDLLPSSLDLIDVQDQLATTPSGKFFSVNPIELLWRATKGLLDDYDNVRLHYTYHPRCAVDIWYSSDRDPHRGVRFRNCGGHRAVGYRRIKISSELYCTQQCTEGFNSFSRCSAL